MTARSTFRHLSGALTIAALAACTGLAMAQGPGRGGPQGRPDYHFQQSDRGRFQSHYQSDANKWRGRPNRPHFAPGQVIPRNYAIRAVPNTYWRGGPPPPPGYQYGYYDGYVVAYNPTTRIVADVLDLVTGN